MRGGRRREGRYFRNKRCVLCVLMHLSHLHGDRYIWFCCWRCCRRRWREWGDGRTEWALRWRGRLRAGGRGRIKDETSRGHWSRRRPFWLRFQLSMEAAIDSSINQSTTACLEHWEKSVSECWGPWEEWQYRSWGKSHADRTNWSIR